MAALIAHFDVLAAKCMGCESKTHPMVKGLGLYTLLGLFCGRRIECIFQLLNGLVLGAASDALFKAEGGSLISISVHRGDI